MNTSRNSSFYGQPSFNTTSSFSNRRSSRATGGGDSQVFVSRTTTHIVEPFGTQLPSMVKVAVNKLDENDTQKVSCRLDQNGWAWLVRKRELYVWRHTADGKRSSIPCRQLLLPASELVHHARLICIVGSGTVPACIAVSPEGHISYWPNISNESATISINADVPGQECDSLSSLWPTGCILATTSATVLLIRLTSGNKPGLNCVSLSMASKGWLGGLSRKMSYLMPMTSGSHLETKRAKVVIPSCKIDPAQPGGKNSTVYVLAGGSIQSWKVTPELQSCSNEFNIDDTIRKFFHERVWNKNADLRGIQIWMLDIISIPNNKLAILAAAMNQGETHKTLHYGITTCDPRNFRARDAMNFTLVKFTTPKADLDEEHLYSWKLLVNQEYFYMISEKTLLIASDEIALDLFTSGMLGSPILGCGLVSDGLPLLFLPRFGLMVLRAQPSMDSKLTDDSFADIRVPDHLSLSMTQHNLLDLSMSEDNVNRYKSAFLNFCGKRTEECTEILNSLFPIHAPRLTPNDPIDIWTVALCEKLIDDAPVSDPRWNSSLGRAVEADPMGIKSKMLIKNFLVDKKEGLELFFGFLKITGIYERLTSVVIREDIEATASVLYNLYEKIRFAMTVHSLQTEVKYRKILDAAVKSVIVHRVEYRAAQLSFNDLFYKDVSRVHQMLSALVQIQEERITESDPGMIPDIVQETTEVILVAFSELMKVQSPHDQFELIRANLIQPLLANSASAYNVTPWYVQHHVLEALVKQSEILVSTIKLTLDPSVKVCMFRQLEQLTDIILDGLKTSIESLKGSDRYTEKLIEFEIQRGKLLDNLLVIDKNETLPLAEKYLDFNVLVSVCYENQNIQKLEDFFDKYANLDFPCYTFEWYIRHKKTAELVETFSLSKSQGLLSNFIKAYPELEWHHLSIIEDFNGAARVLRSLADKEVGNVDDKKFLLCMAKLGALAGGGAEKAELVEKKFELKSLDNNLAVIAYQNELPDDLLEQYAMDRTIMRVLTPSELIDVYTCDLVEVDVKNYWQALALAEYVGAFRQEKRMLIIARAVLRDSWDAFSTEHPIDVIEPSLLYKLVMLGIAQGEEVSDLFPLPDLQGLDMLASVFENASARFLLHACYEHLCSQVHTTNMSE